MGLQGELATFGLADLLQWLEGSRATGTVSLVQEGLDRRLLIEQGALVGVAGAGQWDALMRNLLAAGVADAAQLEPALGRVRKGEVSLEAALATAGVPPQLPQDLAAEELTCALAGTLSVRAGRFVFAEDALPVPGDQRLPLRMGLRELLFDAIRIADEQPQVDRVVGDDSTAFTPVDAGEAGRLGPSAKAVLARMGAGNTVGAVRLALGMSRALCARQVYELVLAGRLQRASGQRVSLDPLSRVLAQGSGLLRDGELHAAALLCASMMSVDPTDRRVREFARAVETEQASRLYARLLPPCVYTRVPERDAQLQRLRPSERLVLQLVNGVWDTATVVLTSPLREVETLQALERLLEMGLVTAAHERSGAS